MAAAKQTIIKRVVVDDHDGHHGGAWKVAYADFMTAMMAFFLLLWILSSSDEQKLRGIAEYFTEATKPGGMGVLDGASLGPPGTLTASNGAILARGSEIGQEDQSVTAKWEVRDTTPTSDLQDNIPGSRQGNFAYPASGDVTQNRNSDTRVENATAASGAGVSEQSNDSREALNARNGMTESGDTAEREADTKRFDKLEVELMQAMQSNPDLRPLMENVVFERTPEGLRIQVIDQQGKPMFASGSAEMLDVTRLLMDKLGQSLAALPNAIVITGHTDAVPFAGRGGYDNWDLSTDRANESRRVLVNAGVSIDRLTSVSGKAYTDPLVPDRPKDPSNRRITVFLQHADAKQPGTVSDHLKPDTHTAKSAEQEKAMNDEAFEPSSDNDDVSTQNVTPLLDDRTLQNIQRILR